MFKEILEKQIDILTGLQDEMMQARDAEQEQSANGFVPTVPAVSDVMAVAAEIRQTAETLARCEYHASKFDYTKGRAQK